MMALLFVSYGAFVSAYSTFGIYPLSLTKHTPPAYIYDSAFPTKGQPLSQSVANQTNHSLQVSSSNRFSFPYNAFEFRLSYSCS